MHPKRLLAIVLAKTSLDGKISLDQRRFLLQRGNRARTRCSRVDVNPPLQSHSLPRSACIRACDQRFVERRPLKKQLIMRVRQQLRCHPVSEQ